MKVYKNFSWSDKTNTAYMRTATGYNNVTDFSRVSTLHLKKNDTTLIYINETSLEENINASDNTNTGTDQVFNIDLDSIVKSSNNSSQELSA